jgi:hypothetical protein
MLAEHKGLAILFAAILIGFVGYGWKVLHAPARHAVVGHGPAPAASPGPAASPPPATPGSNESASADAASAAEPIYIEPVPDKKKEPR